MNSFLEKTKVDLPIIQAGMAGGITTPELVAAVANTGALGTIGAGYMSAAALKDEIRQVKQLTNKPFAVNLFSLNLESSSNDMQEMQTFLNRYRNELEIAHGSEFVKVSDHLQEKIAVILQENIPIVSTAFGVLSSVLMEQLQENNVTLIGMATNLAEAKQLAEAGYDIVVAQGYEAGGHRGTFDVGKHPNGCDIGLIVLVQSFIENLKVPIVAAGGIHTREQIKALLAMGVSGVQLGTKFLLAKEAGTNTAYRSALIKAETGDTVITKAFSGRPARAIHNRFIKEVEESRLDLPAFPIQNALTKDIRAAASKFGAADYLSLWAGQGVGAMTKEETVEVILGSLI